MKDDDFGFTLVDEAEIRKYEEELKQKITDEQLSAREKLEGLRDMFMPLLNRLSRDPDRHYIFWPNRVEKIEEFVKKIEAYIDEND